MEILRNGCRVAYIYQWGWFSESLLSLSSKKPSRKIPLAFMRSFEWKLLLACSLVLLSFVCLVHQCIVSHILRFVISFRLCWDSERVNQSPWTIHWPHRLRTLQQSAHKWTFLESIPKDSVFTDFSHMCWCKQFTHSKQSKMDFTIFTRTILKKRTITQLRAIQKFGWYKGFKIPTQNCIYYFIRSALSCFTCRYSNNSRECSVSIILTRLLRLPRYLHQIWKNIRFGWSHHAKSQIVLEVHSVFVWGFHCCRNEQGIEVPASIKKLLLCPLLNYTRSICHNSEALRTSISADNCSS